MPRQDFDFLNPYGQIRASELRRAADSLGRTGQMLPNGPGVDTSFAQVSVPQLGSEGGDSWILAAIVGNDGGTPALYSWVELDRVTLLAAANPRSGDRNAREINGRPVLAGTKVFLAYDGRGGYDFDASLVYVAPTFATTTFHETIPGYGQGGLFAYPSQTTKLTGFIVRAGQQVLITASVWDWFAEPNGPSHFGWGGYGTVQIGLYYYSTPTGTVPLECLAAATQFTGTNDTVGIYCWAGLSVAAHYGVPSDGRIELHCMNQTGPDIPQPYSNPLPIKVAGRMGISTQIIVP